MYTETVPQVWPASPSLSLPGLFAALLSQHDASPKSPQTKTHTVMVIFFFFFNQTEAQVFLFDGRAHNSVNEGDELLFLFLPLDEMSLD